MCNRFGCTPSEAWEELGGAPLTARGRKWLTRATSDAASLHRIVSEIEAIAKKNEDGGSDGHTAWGQWMAKATDSEQRFLLEVFRAMQVLEDE